MARRMLPFIIIIYAAAFAFAAMTALRLPSMALIQQLAFEYGMGPEAPGIAEIDWRHVSILLGGPYLAAAFCFYISAVLIRARLRLGGVFFKLGTGLGFASIFLFEFRAEWWQAPTIWEMVVAGAACATGLIYLGIIYIYEFENPADRERKAPPHTEPVIPPEPVMEAEPAAPIPARPKRRPRRRAPQPIMGPSPAIIRQRAAMAAAGRKMLSARAQARQPIRWRW